MWQRVVLVRFDHHPSSLKQLASMPRAALSLAARARLPTSCPPVRSAHTRAVWLAPPPCAATLCRTLPSRGGCWVWCWLATPARAPTRCGRAAAALALAGGCAADFAPRTAVAKATQPRLPAWWAGDARLQRIRRGVLAGCRCLSPVLRRRFEAVACMSL